MKSLPEEIIYSTKFYCSNYYVMNAGLNIFILFYNLALQKKLINILRYSFLIG